MSQATFTNKEKQAYINAGFSIITLTTKDGNPSDFILSPIGAIKPPLKEGNTKTGKKVYTFSLLPTNQIFIIDGIGEIMGSCCETCRNAKTGKISCYACKGNYNYPDIKKSLATYTLLAYKYIDFLEKLIDTQLYILGDNVDIRIHAAGDFFNKAYADMWHRLAKKHNNRFWTYTKKAEFETLFDDLSNANIVKSNIAGFGYNYGHIDYLLSLYIYLVEIGEKPYICRCGIDKNQHCQGCNACIDNKYVLFVEHSTEYKAERDSLYGFLCDVVNAQNNNNHVEIAKMIYTKLAALAA